MPNRTPLDIEMKILDFIITYPTYGPQRISNELTRENVPVKPSAVYNVLKRHNLNIRKERLEYMRMKNGIVSTHSDLERDRDKSKTRSLCTKYPGHIVGMDVFYVGTLKGIGRIFQFNAIDTYSSYAWAKLYTDKSAVSACDFMMHVYNTSLDIPIQSVQQLNDDLNHFIEFYNCQRTHQGKRTQGKVPAELYLLTKPQAA